MDDGTCLEMARMAPMFGGVDGRLDVMDACCEVEKEEGRVGGQG